MKSLQTILIFLIIGQVCWASTNDQLPTEPWRAITFMEKDKPGVRWQGDISVKLFGNYTPSDSLMVENSIAALNNLCETINLSITTHDRGKLEVYFLDSLNGKDYESIISLSNTQESSWRYFSNNNKIIFNCNLGVQMALVPEEYHQNFLTNNLAILLYPKYLRVDYVFNKGAQVRDRPKSIFNSISYGIPTNYEKPFYLELSSFDRQVIETVYASNFAELLPLAKKQFHLFHFWLREYAYIVMIFPLILALFLFIGLIVFFYKKVVVKIQNKLLQFNVVSALALLSVGVLTAFYIIISSNLHEPYFSFFNTLDVVGSILLFVFIGLPSLNLFRFIESIIHRKTGHKYFKVLLTFLSTSLIPSGTLLTFIYFDFRNGIDEEGIQAMIYIFLGVTFIGAIRALISFFILKEKELIVENDAQLANLRELKTKAELNALHSKINPHFLYNSLNSIAGLASSDQEKTEHMALSLSKLFRYSINKEQSDWCTLAEEVEMVKIYLDIEKVRFDDRLEFDIDLPEELQSVNIPRFMIQPLVENAIKHGVFKLISKGKITVSIRRNEKWIEIEVSDNGANFPDELIPGFGLQSIYDKLEIMYHNRFEIYFLNAPNKHILIKLA